MKMTDTNIVTFVTQIFFSSIEKTNTFLFFPNALSTAGEDNSAGRSIGGVSLTALLKLIFSS